jgi:hypothetical protein
MFPDAGGGLGWLLVREGALAFSEKTLFFLSLQREGDEGERKTCGC